MSATRFLWRWNARLLRREWRVQLSILAVIAAATTVSIGGVLAAYNLTPPPERDYGNGQVSASVVGDAAGVRAALEDQAHPFGEIQAGAAALPGSARTIEIRVHDPGNPVAAPLLDLVEGQWPVGPDEVAATDGMLRLLGARLGAAAVVADHPVTVVGVVENPTDLDDEFVHAATLRPFDVDPRHVSTSFLVNALPVDVVFPSGTGSIPAVQQRSQAESRTEAALAVNVVAAVAMLEVALLAGAGFAIVSRRRTRQYGLLGAVGAPARYLRRVAAMNGLAVGGVATAAGAILGVASAAAVLPTLESSVGHRIGFAAPWWAVLPVMAMAVAAAAAAAWWPSRALTRQSVVAMLASQRPQIRPVSRTTAIGVVAALAGTTAMLVGFIRVAFPLALGGIVAALVGLLMLSPAAVKLIGRGAGGLPLSVRLAARAIARLQGRSAAVVSALVIALGVPAGLAVASAAIDDRDRRAEDNLPDNMAILWLPGAEENAPGIPAELDAGAAARSLDRATAAVPGARVAPIEVAVDPRLGSAPVRFDRLGLRPAVFPNLALRPVTEPCNCDVAAYGDRDETGAELLFAEDDAWIANPALLGVLGIEVPEADRPVLGLSRWDDAVLHSHRQPDDPAGRLQVNSTIPPFGSIASVLIWPEAVAAHDWEAVTVGWLIVADTPLTPAVRADLRAAAGPDLLADLAVEPAPRSGMRLAGLLVGGVMGLGILVSVVSLHIAESTRDLQILRAIGASPRTGRRVSAATAAILAVSAALIAVPAGYLPLVAMMADRALDFRFVVPWASLAAIVVAFPLLAAAIGWAGSIRTSNRVRSLP